MSKFKVGDRVKVVCRYKHNQTGVVSWVTTYGVRIRIGNHPYESYEDFHTFGFHELELLEEKEQPMAYKKWGDMTREEKGELLLAHHEFKQIQHSHDGIHWVDSVPQWVDGVYYRVKPEAISVVLFGHTHGGDDFAFGHDLEIYHTHKITFDVVDGVVDCSSVKMQEIAGTKEI
jgi:hypothetical protein